MFVRKEILRVNGVRQTRKKIIEAGELSTEFGKVIKRDGVLYFDPDHEYTFFQKVVCFFKQLFGLEVCGAYYQDRLITTSRPIPLVSKKRWLIERGNDKTICYYPA